MEMKKNNKKYLFRDSLICLILSTILIALFAKLLTSISVLNPFATAFKDFSFLDLYYSQEMYEPKTVSDIVLVNIENRDRYQIAQLINHLQQFNPKAIGVDVIFKNPKNQYSDSLLLKALSQPNVVVVKAFVDNEWVNSFNNNFSDKLREGYSNLNFNSQNQVIRKINYSYENQNKIHHSLSYKMYLHDSIQVADKTEQVLAYTGSMNSFLTLGYDEILNNEDLNFIKNKYVLLGYLGIPLGNPNDIEDKFFTPLNKNSSGKSVPDMYGVTIHANALAALINGIKFKEIPKWFYITVTAISTYIALVIFLYFSRQYPAVVMIVKKITQLALTLILLWFSLWLYKNKIYLKPELIIGFLLISLETIGLFRIISYKLYKKYSWKNYYNPS